MNCVLFTKKRALCTALALAAVGFFAISAQAELYGPESNGQTISDQSGNKPKAEKTRRTKESNADSSVGVMGISRFRPIEKREMLDFDESRLAPSPYKLIFNREFEKQMRIKYRDVLGKKEERINDPNFRADQWQVGAYEQARREYAEWTKKEILNDQLNAIFKNADKDSAPMQVVHTLKESTNFDIGGKKEEENLTPEQKAARVHRLDMPVAKVEEEVPTKLKTRMNVLHQKGQVLFQNPVAETAFVVNLKDEEKTAVQMNKQIKALDVSSNLRYGFDKQKVSLDLTKPLMENVNFHLNSERFTGDARGSSGEKSKDTAKVVYSIKF